MLEKGKIKEIQDYVDEAMMQTDMDSDYWVDVEAMARRLGFAVRRLVFKDIPEVIGMMVINDLSDKMKRQTGAKKLIALNSEYDEPHLRFAIAHEIGHYFMHKPDCLDGTNPVYFTQIKDNEEGIEEEACRFAAMLLMDKRQFKNAYEKLKAFSEMREIDVIRDLSKLFIVPQKAVQRRIQEINDE